MYCFDCGNLIVVPGSSPETPDARTPQVRSVEVTCNRCKSRYTITTSKMPGKSSAPSPIEPSDREKERLRQWENKD